MRLILKTIAVSFVLLFSVTATFAQSSTYVKYNISGEGETGQLLNGSTIEFYFNKENFKMEVDMMGGMMAIDVRMDLEKESGIMLMDMMGQKQYKILDKDDMASDEKPGEMPDIEYLSKYKTIAGYKCQKALIKAKDVDYPVVVYFTEEMKVPSYMKEYMEQMKMEGVKGFPLEFEVKDPENGKVTIKAVEVNSKRYPEKIFSTKVPDGYTKMDDNGANVMPGMMGK